MNEAVWSVKAAARAAPWQPTSTANSVAEMLPAANGACEMSRVRRAFKGLGRLERAVKWGI